MSNMTQLRALFDHVRVHFGGLDLLFNNAGLGILAKFESSDPDDWKKMFDANLYGLLNCTQTAIPLLRGR